MSAWLLRAWFKFQFAIPRPKLQAIQAPTLIGCILLMIRYLLSPLSAIASHCSMLFKEKSISKNYFIFRNFPRFALRTNCTQHHLHTSIFSDPPPQSAEPRIVAHFLSAKRHFEKNFLSFKMPPNCVTNNQTATRNTIGTPNPLGLPSPQSTKFWIVAHFPKKISAPKIFLFFRKSSNRVTRQPNSHL